MGLIGKVERTIKRVFRNLDGRKRAKKLGLVLEQPNYIYKDNFNPKSIVVDVGCAHDPDLSLHFIKKYDVFAFGVDPTQKHFDSLRQVEQKYKKFKHLPYAVANENSTLLFYESIENVSGSLMKSHNNVQNGSVVEYEVEALTIPAVISKTGYSKIDYLKIDLEGAEYALLTDIEKDHLKNIDQLFIEFHHHCIAEKTLEDTKKLVKKIQKFGYQFFTVDEANYLFYK